MYDELIKSIHCCFGDDSIQTDCENCMMKDKREEHNYVGCCDALGLAAADAIEELSAKDMPKRVGFTEWKGCRNTRYKCPLCTKYVRNDGKYCHKCGQALMFPIISFTPFTPGKRQEAIISWPDDPPKEATDA